MNNKGPKTELLLQPDLPKLFFLNYFLLTFPGVFVFILRQKGFYCLLKCFVISNVTWINITKEVLLFAPNQAHTEITLFIICLSTNVTFCVFSKT